MKRRLQASDQVLHGKPTRRRATSSTSSANGPAEPGDWAPFNLRNGIRQRREQIAAAQLWISAAERTITEQALREKRSAVELAAALGVSRQTVYNRRR